MSTDDKPRIDRMTMQFHVAVLTVPTYVTPEKFSEWLHREVHAIQDLGDDNSMSIVRLFLAARIKDVLGRKKLDTLMQAVTDRYPNIFRVEMVVVEDTLNAQEMELIQSEAEHELAEILRTVQQLQQMKDAKSRLH